MSLRKRGRQPLGYTRSNVADASFDERKSSVKKLIVHLYGSSALEKEEPLATGMAFLLAKSCEWKDEHRTQFEVLDPTVRIDFNASGPRIRVIRRGAIKTDIERGIESARRRLLYSVFTFLACIFTLAYALPGKYWF